jgi:copper chaperone CopZ
VHAANVEETVEADTLLGELLRAKDKAWRFLEQAEKAKNTREGIACLREVREVLTVLAKIEGRFAGDKVVNIDRRQQLIVGDLSTDEIRNLLKLTETNPQGALTSGIYPNAESDANQGANPAA